MSSPRRVARIVYKNLRLRSRPGYGQPQPRRGRFSGDTGPTPLGPYHRCEGKRPYGLVGALRAADRLPGTVPYRCDGCGHWHVGHPHRREAAS